MVLFLALITAVSIVAMHGCGAPRASRPNIVLIIIDTLRADFLGCYGCPGNVSPEIDEMASKGILFERVYSQCSWTRPSIGSMLTSRYPRSLGIFKEKFDILSGEYSTLAEILSENGYRTIGITANPHLNKVFNFHQGFDDYAESSVIWEWMQPEQGKKPLREGRQIKLPRSGEIFDWVLSKAQSDVSGPAYVQINVMEVHSPSLVLNRYKRLYDHVDVNVGESEPPKRRAALTHLVRGTYCAVTQVSHDVDEFINELSSLPGWDNTLFIITSDHGQGLVDHPGVHDAAHHGNLLYDSQVRVPLVLYNPADTVLACGGRRIEKMVRLLDVLPTALAYAGIDAPGEVDGVSLLRLISGEGAPPDLPEVFVAENGALTDSIYSNPAAAERLKLFLRDWELRFPRADRAQPQGMPTDAEIEQLKSLGYMK
jgi:arylsulfatase A-like enzyme